jgi:hypothetical protein
MVGRLTSAPVPDLPIPRRPALLSTFLAARAAPEIKRGPFRWHVTTRRATGMRPDLWIADPPDDRARPNGSAQRQTLG